MVQQRAPDAFPDASVFVPPPPAPGSAAQLRDEQMAAEALTQKGKARWELAARDADLSTPDVAVGNFSCAAGFEISAKATPKLDKLLKNAATNLGMSTAGVKKKYQRQRPFQSNGQGTCTPDWEAVLTHDFSYPSGHSAIGFGWGLILAELVPDHGPALVARGMAFGDSRRYCNAHWMSDIESGRLAATNMVARLHAERAFQKDMKATRAEIAKARAVKPTRDCAAEAAALSLSH